MAESTGWLQTTNKLVGTMWQQSATNLEIYCASVEEKQHGDSLKAGSERKPVSPGRITLRTRQSCSFWVMDDTHSTLEQYGADD